jgi:hypothetical protein
MSAPNQSEVVNRVADANRALLEVNTLKSIQEFMLILGPEMRAANARWGYLTKSGGEKHITLPDGQFVGVDAFIYADTQQVVDVLSNAADPAYGPAFPTWQEVEKREGNHWYPIKDYEESGGGGGDSSAEIEDIEEKNEEQDQRLNSLESRIAALEQQGVGTLTGRTIALNARVNGKFLRVDMNNEANVVGNGDDSQEWETFVIKEIG